MKHLALVAACLLTVTLASPATADEPTPDPVEVTFPAITELNPEHTPYVVQIHDPQPELGELVATWDEHELPLPHDGSATIPLTAADGPDTDINVLRCPADGGACVGTDHYQYLTLVTRLRFDFYDNYGKLGTASGVPIHVRQPVLGRGDVVHLAWTVTDRDRDDAVVTEGAGDWVVGKPEPVLSIPSDTDATRVHLAVYAVTDSARWGQLEGTAQGNYRVDVDGPPLNSRISSDAVFPVKDGYLDQIGIQVKSAYGLNDVVMEVVGRDGVPMEIYRGDAPGNGGTIGFDGRFKRDRLPAGRYTLRITGYDDIHNTTVDSYAIRIDDRRAVEKTYTKTYPAARTVVDEYVGSCSDLGSAAGRGWKGSLGLYSTPCAKKNGSTVITVHGARVPFSAGGYDQGIQVSLYGGGARGSKSAYLVHGWLRANDNEFIDRSQFNGKLGTHVSERAYGTDVVRTIDGQRWVFWQLGLTDGSRYDVKSFTVRCMYYDLVAPRSRTASDAKTIAEPSGAPGPGYTPPKTDAAELLAAYSPSM